MSKIKIFLSTFGLGLLIIFGILIFSNKDKVLDVPEANEEEQILSNEDNDLDASNKDNQNGPLINHENFEEPMQLVFSSGAGAWSTVMHLSRDGSFTGIYLDSNGGMSGDGYLSTNYISVFTGLFDDIERLDEDTYSMKLIEMNYEHEKDQEWIEDDTKFIATEAYGFEEGKKFSLYSPTKITQDLNEDFLSWGRISPSDSDSKEELGHWALHNEATDFGFYSEQYLDDPEDESEETASTIIKELPLSFDHMEFDSNYSGPGSEFIGNWRQVNDTTVDFAPNPWEINYLDGLFYIRADLPGDPGFIVMTAEFIDGKLYSENARQIELLDYENPDTLEIELPETIKSGDEISQFFFEDGYLQWISEERNDFRDVESSAGAFEGYEKE